MRSVLLCMSLACLLPPAAQAATPVTAPAVTPQPATSSPITLTVAGKTVVLTLPEGACAYDRSQKVDAQLLDMLEKGNAGLNQVLLAFADCSDLAALRRGEPAGKGYYGQILSEYARQPLADSTSRSEYVAEMAKEYNDQAQVQQAVTAGKDKLKAASVDTGDVSMLGIINQAPDFAQAGIIQSVALPDGGDGKIDGIVTLTKLGVPVSINLYHMDDNPGAWAALNTQSVAFARRLVALNADSYILHADERSEGWAWRETFEVSVLGAIAGGIFAFLRRRKRVTP